MGCVPGHPDPATAASRSCSASFGFASLGKRSVFVSRAHGETSREQLRCRRNRKSLGVFIPKIKRERPSCVSVNSRERRIPLRSGSADPVGFASVGWSEMTWTFFVFPTVPWESWMVPQVGRAAGSGDSRRAATRISDICRRPTRRRRRLRPGKTDFMDGALQAGW